MKPIEIVRAAGTRFGAEAGNDGRVKLLPPLGEAEVRELEARIPCPLPEEARELFAYCRGFDGVLDSVDFSGLPGGFGLDEIFPCPISIAHDGDGNYWVVDLTARSSSWGPIFYACHDAPVIVFQSETLADFITEVLRFARSPRESEIDQVCNRHQIDIWRRNPGTMSRTDCLGSGDPALAEFARSLDDSWLIVDLRKARIGDGFSWGRCGARTENRRFGDERIFAYKMRKPLWRRLLGS